jgi:hypothetical protein
MLGAGFDPATVERGLTLNPDVIAVDGGSTDSGPHYLGTGQPKTTAAAVAKDLKILLNALPPHTSHSSSDPAAPAARTRASTGSPRSPHRSRRT